MGRIIRGGKTTSIYSYGNDKIGLRGERYDLVIWLLVLLFVAGFFVLQSS